MKAIAMIAATTVLATARPISATENAHWGYSGPEGPENWGGITQEFAACGSGQNQSPIDYANPVDYNELIPGRQDYFRYHGSLTTPPCTEGVRWVVFKQPLIAAPEQIQHYHDLLGFDNNRPLQPINSRVIVE